MHRRTCNRCSKTYHGEKVVGLAFWKNDRARGTYTSPRSTCKPCEQKKRDEKKGANRWGDKFRRATVAHAKKYMAARHWETDPDWPEIKTVNEFIAVFGWDLGKGAKAMETQYENGCCRCRKPYEEMGHGLQDITVDIKNPEDPPDWENVQFLCMTCNRQKGSLAPEEDQIMQRIYREHAIHMERLERDQGVGTLWEGRGADFSAEIKPLTTIKRNGNHKKKKKLH